MARYVVVEFADNDQAEEFISRINYDNELDRSERRRFTCRIAGVFVKPGRVCECGDWRRTNVGDKNAKHGVVRGLGFGWWVCTRCNRPRRGAHQLINKLLPSAMYEATAQHGFETHVDGLSICGVHTDRIDRPKRLRRKRPKGA